jgi:hypothetical protein
MFWGFASPYAEFVAQSQDPVIHIMPARRILKIWAEPYGSVLPLCVLAPQSKYARYFW